MPIAKTATSKEKAIASLRSAREAVAAGMHWTDGIIRTQTDFLPPKKEVLICVVDDDNSLRKDVTRLLQSEGYLIESFVSTQAFLNRKPHDGPCGLLVDAHLQGLSGFDLQQILSKDSRTEQIVFMSSRGDIRTCAQALKTGAVDFLTKPLKNAELLWAVETALLRSASLLRSLKEKMAAQTLLNQLTPREREVLGFVIAGRLNKVIAAELGTAEKTIKKHRGHIMDKLKVGSVAELVHFSLQSGLLPARPYGTKVPYAGSK